MGNDSTDRSEVVVEGIGEVGGVVIVDLDRPDAEGVGAVAAARLAAPSARIVAVSRFADAYTLHGVLDAGGDAYVDKADGVEGLCRVLVALVDTGGQPVADRRDLDRVQDELRVLTRAGRTGDHRYRELIEREAALLAEQWQEAE